MKNIVGGWKNKFSLQFFLNATKNIFNTVQYRSQVFTQNDSDHRAMPLSSQMLLLLIVFLVLVAYHARLVEVTSRLDFLWKREAERELTEMRETRTNNRQLLRNILPDHVAHHFLSSSRRHTTDVSNFCSKLNSYKVKTQCKNWKKFQNIK